MPRMPSTSSQTRTSTPSNMSRGGAGTPSAGRATSPGSGNTRRSSLPFAFIGSPGTHTVAAGSM